jgi:hypothetical protein
MRFSLCTPFRPLRAAILCSLLPLALEAQRRGGRDAAQAPATPPAAPLTAERLQGIRLRALGPGVVTGRIADIKIDPNHPSTWYIATAFGGLWKTTNRGASFTPLFDDQSTHNLCCIEIDPKNSDVLARHRRKSQPAQRALRRRRVQVDRRGQDVEAMGLQTSEHLGKIIIDPRNSDVVYVASQGPLFSAGGERGLYKTTRRRRARRGRAACSSATTPVSPISCSIRRMPM